MISASCVHSTTLMSNEIAHPITVTRNCPIPSLLSSPMNINFRLEDSSFACKTGRKSGNILPENVTGNNYKLLLKWMNLKQRYCLSVKNSKPKKKAFEFIWTAHFQKSFQVGFKLWNFVTHTYKQIHTKIDR